LYIFVFRAVKEKDKGIAIAFAAFMTTLLGKHFIDIKINA
jgi:hypothetical protein